MQGKAHKCEEFQSRGRQGKAENGTEAKLCERVHTCVREGAKKRG